MFKVVAFKGNRDPDAVFVRTREEQQTNDNKLANNFSRARSMVLQYALCNPWDYFFTGTLDEKKYDRYNVDKFMNDLSQFVRDKRKKYDAKFQVLLDSSDIRYVFENEDGSFDINLAGAYYGEIDYRMQYRGIKGESFDWLYIDFDTLSMYANEHGFLCEKCIDGEHYDYLARLTAMHTSIT